MHYFPSVSAAKESHDSVNQSPKISNLELSHSNPETKPQIAESNLSSSKTFKAVSEFGSAMTNEQIAHELVLDPDFQIKPPQKSALEEQVTAMAKKAFFDAARTEFLQNKYLTYLPGLITDVKEVINTIYQ